jgi:WD40 repeat protein
MPSLTNTLRIVIYVITVVSRFGTALAEEAISYRREIAPVLQTYCLGCHNRIDAEKELSLQSADDILRGSTDGKILNSEAPNDSRLWKVLVSRGDDHMPPADQPQLPPDSLKAIQRWITEGAVFDSRAAVMADLPDVKVSASSVRDPVLSLAISHDNARLAIGRFKAVDIVSADAHAQISRIVVDDGKINDVQFSSNGQRALLATGVAGLSGRGVIIDLTQGEIIREFAGHNDAAYAAVWSPDEQLIATAGYDRRILLHHAESGELIREMNGHNGAIFDLQFSPDGTLLASASGDGTIKVWLVASGERLDTLSQPQAEQYIVRFSPDGNSIYAAGADNRIRKWNLLSRRSQIINPLLISRFAHEGVISSLEVSNDGRYLATSEDKGILKIWDAVQIHEIDALDTGRDRVTGFVFSGGCPEADHGDDKWPGAGCPGSGNSDAAGSNHGGLKRRCTCCGHLHNSSGHH